MGTGINPISDLVQLEAVGGLDATLSPCANCFMILSDAALKIETGLGKTRVFPAGTFTTKTIYHMYVQRVLTGTAIPIQNVLLGFDKNQD